MTAERQDSQPILSQFYKRPTSHMQGRRSPSAAHLEEAGVLEPHTPASIREPCFSFRELSTQSEMRAASHLRYEVYRVLAGSLSSLERGAELELDAFDLCSRHYGLWARDAGSERLVGTLRITTGEPGPAAAKIWSLAQGRASLVARLSSPLTAPLPMMTYLGDTETVRRAYAQSLASGVRPAEAGRLAIDPRVRIQAARQGLRLSRFVMVNALAVASGLRLDKVFIDCMPELVEFYGGFGFEPLAGGRPIASDALGASFVVLSWTPNSVPEHLRPDVCRLAERLRSHGQTELTSRCSSTPAAA